jgi:hypothetical protein
MNAKDRCGARRVETHRGDNGRGRFHLGRVTPLLGDGQRNLAPNPSFKGGHDGESVLGCATHSRGSGQTRS